MWLLLKVCSNAISPLVLESNVYQTQLPVFQKTPCYISKDFQAITAALATSPEPPAHFAAVSLRIQEVHLLELYCLVEGLLECLLTPRADSETLDQEQTPAMLDDPSWIRRGVVVPLCLAQKLRRQEADLGGLNPYSSPQTRCHFGIEPRPDPVPLRQLAGIALLFSRNVNESPLNLPP